MTARRHAGFTLLEITVTLAILGIIMTIVFGVFAQTMAGKEHAEERGEEVASARAVLSRITADLGNVRLSTTARPATGAAATQATPVATPSPARTTPFRLRRAACSSAPSAPPVRLLPVTIPPPWMK